MLAQAIERTFSVPNDTAMKTLNFFPYYEPYLKSGKKTTTFRVGQPVQLREDSEALLTIGWDEIATTPLHIITIEKIYSRRIIQLDTKDFDGESPDCKTPETALLVLGAIYRKILTAEDVIWVVKFRHSGLTAR